MRNAYVLEFAEMNRSNISLVGGKAANLGELSRLEDTAVPSGFCIATSAYQEMLRRNPQIATQLEQDPFEPASIRAAIEGISFWPEFRSAVAARLARFSPDQAWAVRSSATAEDLPGASFAGQQDSYLNQCGQLAVLEHIRKCWASLFSDRAVAYRERQGFPHSRVQMAVLVQAMVFPQVSGILFSADPVSGHRQRVCLEAGWGLGEGLVSGRVAADRFTVREGKIESRRVVSKETAIVALEPGATQRIEVPESQRLSSCLTDEQVLQLAALGKELESHFGQPQDLEWSLVDGKIHVLQSRPMTALFPLPELNDQDFHIYVSVGHQQMMTEAIKPLGLSVWQATAARPMHSAGGRLFVDVAPDLASPAGRNVILNVLGKSDPLIKDAISTLLEREGLEADLPAQAGPPPNFEQMIDYDPGLVPELMESTRASLHHLARQLLVKSGLELLDFILQDLQELRGGVSGPRGFSVIVTATNAAYWLNENLENWLGEPNAAHALSLSLPNNVTSQMGLALLEVADSIRPFPKLVEYLQTTRDEDFLSQLPAFKGGEAARQAILTYLDRYGMRCTGEIDITRPRWSEQPLSLLPALLNHVRAFPSGEAQRRFLHGQQQAQQKEQELLQRLRQMPEGEQKAEQTRKMIELLRNYAGYREFPKYALISRYFLYKQALLREAEGLVQKEVLAAPDEIFFLTLQELRDLLVTGQLDRALIRQRLQAFQSYQKLTPPRVMTSHGETLNGSFQRDHLPAGALAGLTVSNGVVEGRARVVLTLAEAELEEGDILVTSCTDPSWTPLFVSIRGLVTEVGGLMTHGAVIAREYGLPAIVGVAGATRLIRDGQKVRLNASQGYVEVLPV
ncbi:phosphoenolpyruvate synthase [bacterium]|nr:phosphoenolpyruvate synthase [bacterium]